MTNLQKKSLQHISEILKTYNTHSVWEVLSNAMIEAEIDNSLRFKIINKYHDAILEESKKIQAANEWLEILMSDIK